MRKIRREKSVGSTGDGIQEQGRLPQEFCSRIGAETQVLDLGKQREKRRVLDGLPGSLSAWSVG